MNFFLKKVNATWLRAMYAETAEVVTNTVGLQLQQQQG